MTIRELKKLLKTLKKSSITINGLPLKVNIQINQDGETTLDFYLPTSRERRPQAGANEDKEEKQE